MKKEKLKSKKSKPPKGPSVEQTFDEPPKVVTPEMVFKQAKSANLETCFVVGVTKEGKPFMSYATGDHLQYVGLLQGASAFLTKPWLA